MPIGFQFLCEQKLSVNKSQVESVISKILSDEKKKLGQVEIIVVNEKQLLEINVSFLNHDYHTDIITFDNSFLRKVEGELYISYDYILHSANRLNISFENELYRIIIHGVLHLCGYKDATTKDKELMTKKEDFYLKELI